MTVSPSSRPPLVSTKQAPAKLRRQSTFERQSQPPSLPQPTTPTLLSLSRNNSRAQATPPQHTLAPSASFGESIFQSLSFGPFAAKSPRSPPVRPPTMLANVLESPTGVEEPEIHRPPVSHDGPTRRRVTSPDTARPLDPRPPRSPQLTFGDTHPRKARSALRLSRLRPGLAKEDLGQLDGEHTPDTAPSTWDNHTRPSSARGSTTADRAMHRAASVRRPGSAGEIARKNSMHNPGRDDDGVIRLASSAGIGKGRGMRVRASSELTRPSVSLSTILREADEHPPSPARLFRPPLPLSSAGASTLAPVPVSPGIQSTWSKQSGESALADDSDVDADAPTTPSLTASASHTGSRSNSSANETSLDPSHALSSTPKPSAPILDSDALDRTRAREDADRRRRGEAALEREERQRHTQYFKFKGPQKERCHAFSVNEAPYPVSYSPKVLDHYGLDTDLSRSTIQSVTFHKFEVPPMKVLDLGCGTGYWILQAAREWTDTEFVGFDLVPIQPSLERVTGKSGVSINGTSHADLRLRERIRWVHGNFLEELPFGDAEFDMVRCRRIARGVPESKWDGLFEEIVRVMKPGAAFEYIEEDLIFPTEISSKHNAPAVAVYPTPPSARTLPTPPYLSSTSLPSVRPPDQYRRSPSTSFSSVIDSPVEGRHAIPSVSSTSSASLGGPIDPLLSRFNVSPTANHRTTLVVPGSAVSTTHPDMVPARDSRGSGDSASGPRSGQATDFSFNDPRVHTRLEELFVAMHHARWINLKPLSLIPRHIQEHMTGMISSPPVNMYMPPRPREGPLPSRKVDVVELARASGDMSVKQLVRARASELGKHIDERSLDPQPGDEEIAQYIMFDLTRMGTVGKTMPVGQFHINLGRLPMYMGSAVSEVLACKEAMWEYLKEQEPEFDRREYDAMIRQYQTDQQDRLGMGAALRNKLHWGPAESDIQRTPDQRVFDEHYARALERDQADPAAANRQPSVMRCYRAFVAWKAT